MASTIVDIVIEDVNDQLEVYTQIQVERATSFAGVYSLIDTIALVAFQYVYTAEDGSGTINSWYRWRLHNPTGPVDSDYTTPFAVNGVTRKRIRQKVLNEYRAGMVCRVDSTVLPTIVQTDDPRIRTAVFTIGRGKNSSIYMSEGTLLGEERYVIDSHPPSGRFTVDGFTTGPIQGEEFEWHWVVFGSKMNELINKAMSRYLYVDRVPIAGNSNQPNQEYSLADYGWLNNARDVGGLGFYPIINTGVFRPWDGEGRWWNYRVDMGVVYVSVSPRIGTNETVYLEAIREMPKLYDDTTVLPANASLDLAAALTYDECLKWLIQPGQGGSSEDLTAWRQAKILHQAELNNLIRINTPVLKGSKPRRSAPILEDVGPWRAR